jgi:hypothetical protein
LLLLLCNQPLALNLRLSCGETAAPAAGFKLDLLSEADIASLTNGKAYKRKHKEKYCPEESLSLHQSAGRDAEQRRKLDAKASMVVTAEEYAANGISFLGNQFPTGPLNWANSPNKITLVDIMPQVGSAGRGQGRNMASLVRSAHPSRNSIQH